MNKVTAKNPGWRNDLYISFIVFGVVPVVNRACGQTIKANSGSDIFFFLQTAKLFAYEACTPF